VPVPLEGPRLQVQVRHIAQAGEEDAIRGPGHAAEHEGQLRVLPRQPEGRLQVKLRDIGEDGDTRLLQRRQ